MIRWMTVPFTRRMTIIRLGDGTVWLHSPVEPVEPYYAVAAQLGPVRQLVAPNKLHDRYVDAWLDRFPEARFWSGPGFAEANPHVRHQPVELTDGRVTPWCDEIASQLFAGNTVLNEVMFFHRRSRTLILTDTIQNHDPGRLGWFWRLVMRLAGVAAPTGGTPPDLRLTVRDRAAARAAVEQVLAWDFDRLILCHGLCVTQEARGFFIRAMRWLRR